MNNDLPQFAVVEVRVNYSNNTLSQEVVMEDDKKDVCISKAMQLQSLTPRNELGYHSTTYIVVEN